MVCETPETVNFAIKLIGGPSHSRKSVKSDRDMMRSKEGARMVRRRIKDGSPTAKSAPHTTPDDVTGVDEHRPSYVIDSANTTVSTPLSPR